MYAIVKTGGKQYKVAEGDVIEVEKLAGAPGDAVSLSAVLLVDGDDLVTDAAVLANVAVTGEVVETVELLTSEVITNALVHAHSAPELAVRVRHEVVRVEVVDVSPVVPIRRTIETDALSGRGIAIVESLSSQWGVTDLSAQGKTVWFEVAI